MESGSELSMPSLIESIFDSALGQRSICMHR